MKTIRGFSDFGFSYVYVIFEDGTDLYWARSRVIEYLSKIQGSLPPGVKTELGPDATGVGWVYQYALVDKTGTHDLSKIRAYQDWYLRLALQSVQGVAEVASIGGFEKQYQVIVDPNRLQSFGVSLMDVMEAIRNNNNEAGGRLVEFSGREFMVRARGYVKSADELARVAVKASPAERPCFWEASPRLRPGRSFGAAWPIIMAWATRSAGSWSSATRRTRSTSSSASRKSWRR